MTKNKKKISQFIKKSLRQIYNHCKEHFLKVFDIYLKKRRNR